MTVDEITLATRDRLISLLYASASASGLTTDVGKISLMVDQALEGSGFRILAETVQAADAAAFAYADTYETVPPALVDLDAAWRGRRDDLAATPGLSDLVVLP
jgi:hypothetical protein